MNVRSFFFFHTANTLYNMVMKKVSLKVLTSPACTHCHEFLEYWDSAKNEWANVEMEEISVITPKGQEMVQRHMIFSSPGIIINDELFATGGVNKGKFVAKLQELSAEISA
jgi:glutaredoxin